MSSAPPTSNSKSQVPSPEPRHFSFRRRLRAMLDWFHRPRPISAVSDSAPAADSATPTGPTGTAPLTQEQLQAMLPNLSPNLLPNAIPELLAQLLPSLLKDALADPAANPELTRALRAALLGPVVPVGAGLACTTVGPTAPTTANNLTKWSAVGGSNCTITDSVVFQDASNNIGIGTTTPSGPLDVGGWPGIPTDIVGVGGNISGDLFTGNTGGAGRFRLTSNGNQGIFSWNEYYAGGATHRPMDSSAPAWRVNAGGRTSAGEDAFYIQRSPANTDPTVPVRLFQVDGTGNVGIGTNAPQRTLTLGPSRMEAFEIATPGAPTLALTTVTGGALSGTYYYKIVALDSSSGQTLAGSEANIASVTSAVMLKWTPVAGASAYRVYRGTSSNNENVYSFVPATPGGTQAYPDTGATLAGSGTPPGNPNSFAAPAAVAGSSTGSLITTNPYWYTIAALDASNNVLAVSAESVANQLVSGQSSLVITWTPYVHASLAKYRIYRATLVSSVKTYSSGYYEVPVAASLGNLMAFADTGVGATSGSPATVPTAYIVKTGDAQITTAIGEPTVASVRAGEQLLPGRPLAGSDTYGAGIYAKVDMQNQPITAQMFAIYGELLNQVDGSGGFMKIAHAGHGDAIFVPLYTNGGVAIEAASNADGTKGIISTQQGNFPNSTLFQALWQQTTRPGYGMYFADQAPANALVIRKLDPTIGSVQPTDTQIRLTDFNSSLPPESARERFGVFNDGGALFSCAAVSGAVQNSPPLRLRGADTSMDREIKLQNIVSASNQYRLSIQDNSGVEKAAVTNGGELWVKAHTGYADSQAITSTGSVTTTNSTAAIAIFTLPLMNGRAYYIVAKIVARQSDGSDQAFFFKTALAYHQGAGAVVFGTGGLTDIKTAGAGSWAVTIAQSTSNTDNVVINVAGQNPGTVYWVATVEFQSLANSS